MLTYLLYCLTGEPFFLANSADDIDNQQLMLIGTHDADWMDGKLEKIDDSVARNLVSQMLNFDPSRRPSMEQLLMHPFFTGRSVARMLGESAEFDVFISYRVASDASHASLLYEQLTSRGLKVWWDKKCLLAGENWWVSMSCSVLQCVEVFYRSKLSIHCASGCAVLCCIVS